MLLHHLTQPWMLVLVGVVSVARTARLITHDTWPPIEKSRPWLARRLRGWSELVLCPFCVAPYLMAGQILWFWLAYRQGVQSDWFVYGWLLPHLWWAASYVAAVIVAYDQPED
jgi:hypothetical protein